MATWYVKEPFIVERIEKDGEFYLETVIRTESENTERRYDDEDLAIAQAMTLFVEEKNREYNPEDDFQLRHAISSEDYYLEERKNGKLLFLISVLEQDVLDYTNEKLICENVVGIFFNLKNFKEEIDKLLNALSFYTNSKEFKVKKPKISKIIKEIQKFYAIVEEIIIKNKINKKEYKKESQISILFNPKTLKLCTIKIDDKLLENCYSILNYNFFDLGEEGLFFLRNHEKFVVEFEVLQEQKQNETLFVELLKRHTLTPVEIEFGDGEGLLSKEREKADRSQIKTSAQKSREDFLCKNESLLELAKSENLRARYEADDSIFVDIPFIMNRLSNFEDAFTYVFNQYGVNWIVNNIIKCLAERTKRLLHNFCRIVLHKFPPAMIQRLISMLTPDIQSQIAALAGSATDSTLISNIIVQLTPEDLLCALILALLPGIGYLIYLIVTGKMKRPKLVIGPIPLLTDILEQILREIEALLDLLLSAVLVKILKDLLNDILHLCRGDVTNISPLSDKDVTDIVKLIPIDECDFGEENLKKLFHDIALLLTSHELCSLFAGNPTGSVRRIIEEYVAKEFPEYKDCLTIDFFKELGKFLPFDFCSTDEEGESITTICDTKEDLRRRLLEGRASKEEIDRQLEMVDEENVKRANELIDLVSQLDDVYGIVSGSMQKNITEEPEHVKFTYSLYYDSIFKSFEKYHEETISSFENRIKESQQNVLTSSNDNANLFYLPNIRYAWKKEESILNTDTNPRIIMKGFINEIDSEVSMIFYDNFGEYLGIKQNNSINVQLATLMENNLNALFSGRSILYEPIIKVLNFDIYNLSNNFVNDEFVILNNKLLNILEIIKEKDENGNYKYLFLYNSLKEKIENEEKEFNNLFNSKEEKIKRIKAKMSKPILYLFINYILIKVFLNSLIVFQKYNLLEYINFDILKTYIFSQMAKIVNSEKVRNLFVENIDLILEEKEYNKIDELFDEIAQNIKTNMGNILPTNRTNVLENIVHIDDYKYLLDNGGRGVFVVQKYTRVGNFKFHFSGAQNLPIDFLEGERKHGIRLVYVVPTDLFPESYSLRERIKTLYKEPINTQQNISFEYENARFYLIPIAEYEIEATSNEIIKINELVAGLRETENFKAYDRYNIENILLLLVYNIEAFSRMNPDLSKIENFLKNSILQLEAIENYKFGV